MMVAQVYWSWYIARPSGIPGKAMSATGKKGVQNPGYRV